MNLKYMNPPFVFLNFIVNLYLCFHFIPKPKIICIVRILNIKYNKYVSFDNPPRYCSMLNKFYRKLKCFEFIMTLNFL